MALHSYSTTDFDNTDERHIVLFRLSIISGVIGIGITVCIGALADWGKTTTIGAPSTIVIYLALVRLFEKHLWKSKIGKAIGIKTPNLNGTWKGVVRFIFPSEKRMRNPTGILTIEQNWLTIGIGFKTNKSVSYTDNAAIIIQPNEIVLTYHFYSEKRRPDIDLFEDHKGTASFRLMKSDRRFDLTKAEAQYYTSKGEIGRIQFEKSI